MTECRPPRALAFPMPPMRPVWPVSWASSFLFKPLHSLSLPHQRQPFLQPCYPPPPAPLPFIHAPPPIVPLSEGTAGPLMCSMCGSFSHSWCLCGSVQSVWFRLTWIRIARWWSAVRRVITLKAQTQNTNKSSAGEFADVRCRGFVVRSLLIFLSKTVLHFDYLLFLKAIQVGQFCLGLFSWD